MLLATSWSVFWAKRLDRDTECERILSVTGGHYERVVAALDAQFKLLHGRAQVLLAICGVLMSTSVLLMTGKIISAGSWVHPIVVALLIGAGVTEIVATAIVVGGVLNVRWMTQLEGTNLREWVMASLRYRDAKTRSYRVAILLVLVAMALYQAAVVIGWVHGAITVSTHGA